MHKFETNEKTITGTVYPYTLFLIYTRLPENRLSRITSMKTSHTPLIPYTRCVKVVLLGSAFLLSACSFSQAAQDAAFVSAGLKVSCGAGTGLPPPNIPPLSWCKSCLRRQIISLPISMSAQNSILKVQYHVWEPMCRTGMAKLGSFRSGSQVSELNPEQYPVKQLRSIM